MKSVFPTAAAVAAIAIGGWQSGHLTAIVNPDVQRSGADAHESDASVSLLGQFRTSLSTWLWLKSDLYVHNGVEMRPMTEAELSLGFESQADADGWHAANRDTEPITTVIPGQSRDFRGWLGDLERATTTYRDMSNHRHNQPFDTMPLYRLINWCDPDFIPAWLSGAMALAGSKHSGAADAAIAYIEDGVRQNPESIALLTDYARLKIKYRGELRSAIVLLDRACKMAERNYAGLPEGEKEAVTDAFRWLALAHKALGDFDAAKGAAHRGLRLVGHDGVLEHFLDIQPALLLPEKASKGKDVEPEHVHTDSCAHDGHSHAGH